MKRDGLARPTLQGMVSSSNSQTVSIRNSAQHQPPSDTGASYDVSESGARLTLGTAYQVSSTGTREFNPVTGSVTRLGRNELATDYQLGLAASQDSSLRCTHISELDFDNGILVGRGSSGRIYNVAHITSGVRVCVKQMQIDDSRHREEVKRELDSLHKAASRFIVDFYGAFFHNDLGVILLVLELMNGSLHDIMKFRHVLSEEEAKAVTLQVVLGLDFLHNERQLLHRDIKPANILYHRSGRLKITDFGVSHGQTNQDPASVTTFVGSILYMSPERLNGLSYSFESDIWSLGVTLCEAVTGCHPYQDESGTGGLTFWELLQKVLRNDGDMHRSPVKRIQRPLMDVHTLSDELDDFVAQCLKFDRAERATAGSLLQHPWLSGMTLERSEFIVCQLYSQMAAAEAPAPQPQQLGEFAGGLASSAMFQFDGAKKQAAEAETPEGKRQRSLALMDSLLTTSMKVPH